MDNAKQQVLAMLGRGQSSKFTGTLMNLCGNATSAIFLGECVTWVDWAERKAARDYFWRSYTEWEDGFAITRNRLAAVRSHLEPHGIVESRIIRLSNGKTSTAFSVNWEVLLTAIRAWQVTSTPIPRLIPVRKWRREYNPENLPTEYRSSWITAGEIEPERITEVLTAGSQYSSEKQGSQRSERDSVIQSPKDGDQYSWITDCQESGLLTVSNPTYIQDQLTDQTDHFPPYPPAGEPEGEKNFVEAEIFGPEPEPPSDIPGPPPQQSHPGHALALAREQQLRAGHQKILSFEARFAPRSQDPEYVIRDAQGRLGFDPRLEAIAVANWDCMREKQTGRVKISMLRQTLRRKFYEDRQILDDFWAEAIAPPSPDDPINQLGRLLSDNAKNQTEKGLSVVQDVGARMMRGEKVGLWN